MIKFGDFAPGIAPTTQGYSSVADGVIPRADGSYGPMRRLVPVPDASALAGAPRGVISLQKADGSFARFVATADKWYTVNIDGTYTQIASGNAVPTGDNECFIHFGSKLLGTNAVDGLRVYDVDSGGSTTDVSGAPIARYIFEWANVLIALDCDGDNMLIRNSDINDHTSWTTGVGVADSQPLENGGPLIAGAAISSGAAIILQKEAVRLIQLQSTGALYSLTLLESDCGAVSAKSVVSVSGGVYFLDTDGFKFASTNGIQRIGRDNGISDWFLSQTDDISGVEGAYDRFRNVIWWRYKATGDSDTVYSKLLGYHPTYNKWVTAPAYTSAIFSTATTGYTWDTLPDVAWDSAPDLPWDDRFWAGGDILFGALDASYKFATFSGTAMAATLETSISPNGKSAMVNRISLIGDAPEATLQVGTSDRLQDPIAWRDGVPLTQSGNFPIRARGQNMQFRLSTPIGASWSYLSGLDGLNEATR